MSQMLAECHTSISWSVSSWLSPWLNERTLLELSWDWHTQAAVSKCCLTDIVSS